MRAAEVRDVEALDPQRDRVEPERLLQALERLDALLASALGAQLLLVEREPRVALGQLEDAALVAALGGAQLDARRRAARASASATAGGVPTSRCTTISGGIDIASP